MINVMVNVVMLDKEYEFKLDRDVRISELVDEIAEMVSQREQYELKEGSGEFLLYTMKDRTVLPSNSTLRTCGVRTGDILYFA